MLFIVGACASSKSADSTPGEVPSSAGQAPLGAQGVGPSGAGPLAFGVKSTIQDAAKEVSYELLLPSSDLANDSTLSQVWLDKEGQAVGLVYQGDQLTLILQPSTYEDPKAVFEQRVASGNAKESLGSVGQDPALLIEPNTDSDGENPAWVEFVRDGVDVNVESSTYSLDQVVAVADSLSPQPS